VDVIQHSVHVVQDVGVSNKI